MDNSLLLHLVLNVGLLFFGAAALTELRPLRHILQRRERSVANQLSMGLIFGLLSVGCTYTGLSFQGAVVNTRVITTLTAGLVGGPLAGVLAGALSGLHRYLYDPAGFTSLACALGTLCFGLLGALCCGWFARRAHRYTALIALTVGAELLQCLLILLLSKPFSASVALERAILLPKIAVNSVGIAAFLTLLDRLSRDLTIELAEQQALALLIAQKCLPYLREGMGSRAGLQKAADTVRETLPDFQVMITDTETVLAASGVEWSGAELPAPVCRALERGELYAGRFEPRRSVTVHTAIAAPLRCEQSVVGTLMLIAPMSASQMPEADRRTAESLSQFFSAMLELGELEHQVKLRQQAELRALQSQINPHFLFNALNTISALCLADPERAREMILVLARYFRQTLLINEPFVTLEQELSNVNNYLYLTEARFEDAIHVTWELPDDLQALRLPPLILQPIVENAIRHGFVAVDDRRAHIAIRQDATRAYVRVSDQGRGFPPEVLQKLRDPNDPSYSGLFNVCKRLRSIYGGLCEIDIQSSPQGSTVAFSVPLVPPRSREEEV
ncbi:MAG: histidine kinase [Oscillospiraceae bacterium]|nr:histidine kinase [Oscillospiraceae bacterium]